MSVSIQIHGDNAGEAARELAELAAHLCGGQAVIAAPTPKPDKQSSSRSTSKPSPELKAAPAPEQETPPLAQKEPESQDGSDEPGDGDAPIPTVVDLRAKAQEVGTTPEAKKAIKALLDEFGSKSISDVPEDQRNAFMSALAGLA